MRILIVSEVFWPEDFIINDLAQEWVAMGHTVEVLTQYPSYPQGICYEGYKNEGNTTEEWNGIKIHRFPLVEGYRDSKIKKFSNYLSFINEGKKRARALGNNYDCIFVSQTGPLTVALPAIALGKKYDIPVYVWTCDIWPDVVYSYGVPKNFITDAILSRVIRNVYNNCTKILVSSKRFAETISQYTKKEIIYAPNWLRPVKEEKSDISLDKNLFHFTFTGNISRYQNLINTVRGFAKADIKDAVLNIVGDGSFAAEVKEEIEKLGAENIIMHGRKPYNQMNDLLCQSDVLVLPLMPNEGIMKTEPYKIQSYLHAGKTIFGILEGSGKDIIEENNIGVCAKPDDIDSIAKGFKEVKAYSKEYEQTVRENALKLMNDRFCKDRIVDRITEVVSSGVRM